MEGPPNSKLLTSTPSSVPHHLHPFHRNRTNSEGHASEGSRYDTLIAPNAKRTICQYRPSPTFWQGDIKSVQPVSRNMCIWIFSDDDTTYFRLVFVDSKRHIRYWNPRRSCSHYSTLKVWCIALVTSKQS
jgi:hypothetical protein